MRADFDRLLCQNLPAVFAAVLEAATIDKVAAANLLLARGIPVRRGAVVNFSLRPLKTAEDCADAYDDLLSGIAAGKLTPDESRLIADIVAKRAELFQNVALEAELTELRAQVQALLAMVPRQPPNLRVVE